VLLLSKEWSIRLICNILGISFSSFYAWFGGRSHQKSAKGSERLSQVKSVFEEHRRRYGSRRIKAELKAQGIEIGRRQVIWMMKEQGLKAIQPRSFVPRTTQSESTKRSPNLLLDREPPDAPGQVLVGDITYIPLRGGQFAYLSVWQDMYTRQVVGWALDDNMRSELIINALQKAINRRKYAKGTIIHSDGGSQYGSGPFKATLKKHKLLSSMTRKDNVYDNAMGESFFSRLKAEVLEKGVFEHIEDAYTEIFDYLEIYYNTKRRHGALNYQIPDMFEVDWEKRTAMRES
jgi:putative transposase